MLYYIVMSEKNPFSKNKPIEDVRETLESLVIDIKGMKSEITRMKEYVRKLEVREQLKEEKEKQVEKEYVQPSAGWFW
jgi:predicted RNase H-like nuclease (RuvC/YqgF family)